MFKSFNMFPRISFAILFIGLVLTLSINADKENECGKNQEWNECGSACPPTCENRGTRPCTLQCIIGCQCKQGYLLNDNGDCVSPRNC